MSLQSDIEGEKLAGDNLLYCPLRIEKFNSYRAQMKFTSSVPKWRQKSEGHLY